MAYQALREEIEIKKHIDYKDVAYLKQFTNPHAKMLSKRKTGIPSGKQREIALAIKRARFMALLPYVQA
ncbi:30S ribosomal protein S18 [Candidatus Kaiserbacteria bacterium RIFCSPLOWO2_02_FULL_56_11]|uniref:Small ribosomal subunit protein bS18 n=1 Tax=Candidatus Kaiserbacteria bacterium RIFCSPHIGHO2_02_FULL_56_30 TaxID=1798499 RepID=A0A1F6E2R9_9BACT|nr:MAG: 30S ribosomal protein S18 [Candidatus Kaiserbacteria bacterium RIFCSPHIGHO2_02_FULL_56_30]OGG81646.1 MAG: 30S ribosomal protein S18 [Candidatus Kaiserbacteria bacterium RIFCSPLOWO2_02_FULL_56_11]